MGITIFVVVVLALAATNEAFQLSSPVEENLRKVGEMNIALSFSDFDPALIDKYLLAFIDGLKADKYVKDSKECIVSAEAAITDLYSALLFIAEDGPGALKVLKSTEALGSLDPFIKTCYTSGGTGFTQLIKHFKQFTSVGKFFEQLFMNAIGNFTGLKTYSQRIEKAYADNDIEALFKYTGALLRTLLDFEPEEIFESTATKRDDDEDDRDHSKDDTLEQIFHFAVEFIKATKVVQQETGFETQCLLTFEILDDTVKSVPFYAQEGSWKEAVFSVADVFGGLNPMAQSCYETVAEVAKQATEYQAQYTTAINLMIIIVYNFGDLYDQTVEFVVCLSVYDGRCAGKNLGEIVHTIFLK